MQSTLSAMLQELSAVLRERYGDRNLGLWLYGSQATGEARLESDVGYLAATLRARMGHGVTLCPAGRLPRAVFKDLFSLRSLDRLFQTRSTFSIPGVVRFALWCKQ